MEVSKKYRVGRQFDLEQHPTLPKAVVSKSSAKDALKSERRKLAEFQTRLFAHDRYAVLVCFQGMDTSGKDSLIREVFKDFNVRGVQQHSFKVPTELERSHGYLWRHYIALPQKGTFAIFNRSHYENVLVTRVHPEYLLAEKLPDIHSVSDVTHDFWQMRFEQIRNFEKELVQNGTIIFKFHLNLSKEEQKNRLLRRLEKPEKNWKFSEGDLKERRLWDKYVQVYEQALINTSTDLAPWYSVPADDKPNARLIVARILNENLLKLHHIKEPTLDAHSKQDLVRYKETLLQEQ